MKTPLPQWRKIDSFKTQPHQAVVDRINTGMIVGVVGDLELRPTMGGMTLIDRRNREIAVPFLAYVHDEGPNGEADKTDERYWLRLVDPEPVSDSDDGPDGKLKMTDQPDDEDPGGGNDKPTIICAHNFAEMPKVGTSDTGTHDLELGTIVEVSIYEAYYRDGITDVIFGFTSGGQLPPLEHQWQGYVQVSANQLGGEFDRLHSLLDNT